MNLIDFHVHGKGSYFKDKFANASYEDICKFFQGVAEEEGKDLVVAFTDHDNVAITYDEFKRLREKYPRVKIVLGMESNAKLTYSTNGLFEKAHVLLYADMSSEEGIKKWFDCKELQALSKINTFLVRFPSPYLRIKTNVEKLNAKYNMKLDAHAIAKKFEKLPPKTSNAKIKYLFCKYIAEVLYKAKDDDKFDASLFYEAVLKSNYNSSNWDKITFENIYDELFEIPFLSSNSEPRNVNLGNSLYVAKNVLDKYLGLKISNIEFDMILDESKSYEQMRKEFLTIVKYKIEKHNPELFNKIKNLSLDKFSNYKIASGSNGAITLNSFFPMGVYDKWMMGSEDLLLDIRTRLSELDTIAKKTGGYLMLAHPNSMFSYGSNQIFTKEDFSHISKGIISESKYKELEAEFSNHNAIPFEKVKGKKSIKNKLLKMDLFFNVCKSNGINFSGFEITKTDLAKNTDLLNKLIYAAKNNYEVSFGSDTHLSKSSKYYRLLKQNKITEKRFAKLKKQLISQGDTIAHAELYKKLYGQEFKNNVSLLDSDNHIHKIKSPILKKHPKEPLYAAREYNRVVQTSFADKVFNINQNISNKPLFVMEVKDKLYSFNKNELKQMSYIKSNKNYESKDLEEELD